MARVLLIFVDGVGLGSDDDRLNPFHSAALPTLRTLLDTERITESCAPLHAQRASLVAVDATLGVAGVPHADDSPLGEPRSYPSAYVGLECANGERLVLAHIRGLDASQHPEAYAREVIDSILQGHAPEDLGITIDD